MLSLITIWLFWIQSAGILYGRPDTGRDRSCLATACKTVTSRQKSTAVFYKAFRLTAAVGLVYLIWCWHQIKYEMYEFEMNQIWNIKYEIWWCHCCAICSALQSFAVSSCAIAILYIHSGGAGRGGCEHCKPLLSTSACCDAFVVSAESAVNEPSSARRPALVMSAPEPLTRPSSRC